MNVVLKLVSGSDLGRLGRCILRAGPSLIGSAENCSLRLSAADISQWHCILDVSPNAVYVTDLHSLCGTYVNERRIIRQALKDGDCLRIGEARLLVEIACADQRRTLAGRSVSRSAGQTSAPSVGTLPLLGQAADTGTRDASGGVAGRSADMPRAALVRQLAGYEKALNSCSAQLRVLIDKVSALESKLDAISSSPGGREASGGGAFARHDAMMYIARAAVSDRARQRSLPSSDGN